MKCGYCFGEYRNAKGAALECYASRHIDDWEASVASSEEEYPLLSHSCNPTATRELPSAQLFLLGCGLVCASTVIIGNLKLPSAAKFLPNAMARMRTTRTRNILIHSPV